MITFKKEFQLIATFVQTVLQFRMDNSSQFLQHIRSIRKDVKEMIRNQTYEPGITNLLLKRQHYKIKKKIEKRFMNSAKTVATSKIYIKFECLEKSSGNVINEQFWEFELLRKQNGFGYQEEESNHIGKTIAEILEFLFANLFCYSVFPIGVTKKSKYMVDYKIKILQDEALKCDHYDRINEKMCWGVAEGKWSRNHGISIRHYSNQSFISEEIQFKKEQNNYNKNQKVKKSSTGSTVASNSLNLNQFYDQDLDVTILSNQGDEEDDEDDIQVLRSIDEECQEFQLLTLETLSHESDLIFLNQNTALFEMLADLEKDSANYLNSSQ